MITIETTVRCPLEHAWECWTNPEHIVKWNHASDDWHTPAALNDLKINGRFRYTMAAKDESAIFDFEGTYTKVEEYKSIAYVLDDGRNVRVSFEKKGDDTRIVETFDAETVNSEELQRTGWQAILDNFKKYAEGQKRSG